MGCASSAVMPFLSEKHPKTVVVSSGPPTARLNNKVDSVNGFVNNAKDVNTFVSGKRDDEGLRSTMQNALSNVADAKDNIVHQLQDAGENVMGKVSSVVEDVEDKFESAFGQVKQKIDEVKGKMEDKADEEVKEMEHAAANTIKEASDSLEKLTGKEDDESQAVVIDEILATLPEDDEGEKKTEDEKKDE